MEDRNLDLIPRDENIREKYHTYVVKFELVEIYQHFVDNIKAIKAQFYVTDELIKIDKTIEAEMIWRSQVVLLASALDFYMHELTKFGLCQIYSEKWDKTEKYKNIEVKMEYIEIAFKYGEEVEWFLEYINEYYKKITMVSFESIKEQFNLLGIDLAQVANGAFYKRGANEKTKDKLRRRINELYTRRNSVAHQLDRMHTDAQTKDISKALVEEFSNDIENIVKIINNIANNK